MLISNRVNTTDVWSFGVPCYKCVSVVGAPRGRAAEPQPRCVDVLCTPDYTVMCKKSGVISKWCHHTSGIDIWHGLFCPIIPMFT